MSSDKFEPLPNSHYLMVKEKLQEHLDTKTLDNYTKRLFEIEIERINEILENRKLPE